MYPPASGRDLTPEQARELDDTFLASDPFSYFRSRIAGLLNWHEAHGAGLATPPPESSIRAEFNAYMQHSHVDDPMPTPDVEAQIAADALALRHHVAEALVRLAAARLTPPSTTGPRCLWVDLSRSEQHLRDVEARLSAGAREPDAQVRAMRAFLPRWVIEQAATAPGVDDALGVFLMWLSYARHLLRDRLIDVPAAHNKAKHGLAVRARADFLSQALTTPPSPEGTIPASVLNGPATVKLIDQPLLEVLADAPKVDKHRQGLELTQLRLKPSALLADAYMLAWVHGALFHVAAAEHFADRTDTDEALCPPAFPGLPVGGPKPEHIDAEALIGMRWTLTNPPGGGPPRRDSGIGFRDVFIPVRVGPGQRVRVVDDP